ncbi:MAG: hypothetical protein A2896_01430 [Candidatus Nealsonbacteria bacterium RIFCSPLOWO2_01_FULL_43_32]|uniref:S-adenosyl-L-homocysteine hydrolase NAD binding domain-containing protein n=1 Tax=Candidatus Nealsonbacteria bacterium RIFCSPLOWO2_01_FULL_43_32 TaxID=1801672 RepID=A0A1G2EDU9_9BACT|nr:MAG: hypothetical protein A2896_01430 [Candidatus Nealsonbacteria bacterium RIFCSPLOWO2_01_FULL_43_32]
MSKILITTSSFGKADQGPLEKLEKGGFEIIQNPYGRKVTSEELRDLLPGVVGLIAGTETIDRETLKNSSLKVISRVGVGIDSIDLEAAKELGIVVKNTPEAPTVAVAELTLGGILALLRQIPQMDQAVRQKIWDKKTGVQLSGKTVLIIGFGRIGRYLAKMLAPFSIKLITIDSSLPGISLETALPQADIICLHASGLKQILGASEFALMKDGVFLINSARGELWDENALIEALRSGKAAGAYIDVFSKEPYAGPLTEFKQVILTPHIGSNTKECRVQMEREAVDNLLAGLNLL